MKKIALIVVLSITFGGLFAQSKADILKKDVSITWLGIDYSHVKFLGDALQFGGNGEISEQDMVNKYFPGWNNLVINESDKFDVAKATKREKVSNSIASIMAINKKTNISKIFLSDPDKFKGLKDSDIQGIVKKYQVNGKGGIGLAFIMESMSKTKESASLWVVFLRMSDKEVLLAKQLDEKAGGFGFRNYWASPIYKTLKSMKSDLDDWVKK